MNDNINENNINELSIQDEEAIATEDILTDTSADDDIQEQNLPGEEMPQDDETSDESNEVYEENDEVIEEPTEEETIDEKITNKLKRMFFGLNRIPPEKRGRFFSLALISALVLLMIFTDIIPILPNAYNRFYVGNDYVIGETQNAVFDKIGDNVIYAASGTIKAFGPDMDCKFSFDTPTGTPMLETNGENAIVYYENSNEAFLVYGSEVKKLDIKEKIKGASVTSGSYYGIIREEPGYVSCVEIFKKGGTSLYKWHTNSSVIDISVSENGKYMVASTYEADNNNASTRLYFFDLSMDKPTKEVVLKSNIASELKFINSDTVIAFGDLYTQAYSSKGSPSWRIDYKGRIPKSYDIGKNNEIAFIFDRYSSSLSESTVELYNKNGNLRGIYDSKENIKYISCNNGYVLLSLDRQTVLLDNDADAVKIKNTKKDFKKAILYDNYNFAFSISDGIAEIMSVKH